MKLCLIFGIILSFVPRAHSHVEVNSSVRQYDDSKTQVLSPHLEVKSAFFGDRATIGAGYAMDIVSSASSDVTSYASKPIKDTRKEISGGLGWLADGGSYSWNYINSRENDYESDTYSIGATKEFFDKNTIVGLGFAYGDDEITSSANSTFKKYMTNQTFSSSVTQVLSKQSVIQLLYDLRVENGYTASPYRKARIKKADGSVQGIPENHPLTRNRNSFALKYNYFWKPTAISLGTSVRLYNDSWLVTSYTVEQRLVRDFSRLLSVALNFRYYHQEKANFYKDTYGEDTGPFYTGNKTLATYDTYQIGLRPFFTLSDELKFYVKGEYYQQKFLNHTELGRLSDPYDDKKLELTAYVFGAGLESRF